MYKSLKWKCEKGNKHTTLNQMEMKENDKIIICTMWNEYINNIKISVWIYMNPNKTKIAALLCFDSFVLFHYYVDSDK